MHQIQPQVQLQVQLSAMPLEQHSKSQPHRPNSQYNQSPEKSRGSFYLLSNLEYFINKSDNLEYGIPKFPD